jgi:hypothetical protein
MVPSRVVLCVCVAVLLCGVSVNAQENYCDPSCSFADRTWGANPASQLANLPSGLEGVNFDYYALDGNETWWDLCVIPLSNRDDGADINFKSVLNGFRQWTFGQCLLCRPEYVYLYQSQLRLFSSSGLSGVITYISNSYQPTEDAWTNFCLSVDLDLPEADAILEDAQGADVELANAPACYTYFSCAYSQTAPLQGSHTCTPDATGTGFPSKQYCNFVYGLYRFNFQIKTGCNGGGCDTLKLIHTSIFSRKQSSKRGTSRLGRLAQDDFQYCLVPDTSFYSG